MLPEYREYERTMTTLVDAAVKPKVAAYVASIAERLRDFGDPAFAIMKSNGGVASASEVAGRPITTVLSGPAAGALGAGLLARNAGFDRVLTLDGGGTSTDVSVVLEGEPTLTTEGSVGELPEPDPDDRRRHGRRRRRLRRVGLAGGRAARSDRARPAPTPGRCATARAVPSPPSPTRTSCSGGSRRTCSAAASRSTSRPRAPGWNGSPTSSGSAWRTRPAASWRSARGTRRTPSGRSA